MTPAEILAQMQGRCDAATEGPWWSEPYYGSPTPMSKMMTQGERGFPVSLAHYLTGVNADLIAHARTDLPVTIKALQAVLDVLDLAVKANPESADVWRLAEAVRNAVTQTLGEVEE